MYNRKFKICFAILSLLLTAITTADCKTMDESLAIKEVLFVNAEAEEHGDGSSWNSAFNNLQDALAAAESGDQIWVAEGIYYPTDTDDRLTSLVMKDGVDLYGGFSGNEQKLKDRNWITNKTIISGNIGDPDIMEDNSRRMVIAADSIIDGFTLQEAYNVPVDMRPNEGPKGGKPPVRSEDGEDAGLVGGPGHRTPDSISAELKSTNGSQYGSAIIIYQANAVIRNCTITNNVARHGGAIYICGYGNDENHNVIVPEKDPIFINCKIINNTATTRGGGIAIDMCAFGFFIDCTFTGNVCESSKGGAIYNDFGCSPSFFNCLFDKNMAEAGAGIASDGESNARLNYCTFTDNTSFRSAAALYQGSGPFNDVVAVNSIIWGNICDEDEVSIYNWNECNTQVRYSIVQNGYEGKGVLDIDPLFLDTANYDLDSNSPALTAGNNSQKIGFDSTLLGTRNEEEISGIIASFDKEVPYPEYPTPIDMTFDKENLPNIDGNIIYVTTDGTGEGNSWTDALGNIQIAINTAHSKYSSTGEVVSIWVAEGIYFTGETRRDSILLREGVNVYGGFSGTEKQLSERDYTKYQTTLSADIGIINDKSDNAYHVLVGSNDATIDGFTIANGNADRGDGGQTYDAKGGGMLNYKASYRFPPSDKPLLGFNTVVNNCTFKDNFALEGGAVYSFHGSSSVFTNCAFLNNEAHYAGAIMERCGGNSEFYSCTFDGNKAKYKGGAFFIDYGSMSSLWDSKLINNVAGTNGGAIYIMDRASQAVPNETNIHLIDSDWAFTQDIFSSAYAKNTDFIGNKAGLDGGAFYLYEGSNLKLENYLLDGNKAGREADNAFINQSTLIADPIIKTGIFQIAPEKRGPENI
jgi:predicted outer membrane repeat protein